MSDAATLRMRALHKERVRLQGQGVYDVETVFTPDHPPEDPSIEALVDDYVVLLRGLAELLELK